MSDEEKVNSSVESEEKNSKETNSRKAGQKKKFRWWRIPIWIFVGALVIVAGYIVYLFATYSRIEDNIALTVNGNAEAVAETGQTYTAITHNYGFGAYTDDFTFFMDGGKQSWAASPDSVNTTMNALTDIALAEDPDLVFIQEVDTDSTRTYHINEVDMINEKFQSAGQYDNVYDQNFHSAYLMYPIEEPHGASKSGILTESKFNITSSIRRSLPVARGFNKILDLDRCYDISRIPVENGKELVTFNTHLSAYGTDEAQGNAQLQMIFDDMKKEYDKGNYVILAGDFNHDYTGESKEYFNPDNDVELSWTVPFPDDIIPKGLSKCTDYAEGLVPSARNVDVPYSPECFTVIIDGFIISDNIKCTYVQNLDYGFKYSDHNPVKIQFELLD